MVAAAATTTTGRTVKRSIGESASSDEEPAPRRLSNPKAAEPPPPLLKNQISRRLSNRKEPLKDQKNQVIVVSDKTSFLCGLMAGVMQAGIFNPVDRALYLSVRNRVPFLTKANFANPYLGFAQSVGGRALSGGLYYPLEDFYMNLIPPDAGPWANMLAGTGAGMTNALLLNPITTVKYKTWSRSTMVRTSMYKEARNMYRKGGIRPFTNGLRPTLCRDVVFGGCYTYLRLELQYYGRLTPEYQFVGNMVAAALATVLSGPFNLARNVQYATKSKHLAPSIQDVLYTLAEEVKSQPTSYRKWVHVQNRLRIGWGTVRVAIGMAFGQWVYEELMWLMAVREETPSGEVVKMVEKPIVKYPTRRPSLVQYRQTKQLAQLREALEEEGRKK